MADPVSIGASIVTLVGACTAIGERTVKFVEALRDAPLELAMLSNEVNDLNVVLNEVGCVYLTKLRDDNFLSEDLDSTVTANIVIEVLVRSAKEEVDLLDAFVKSLRKNTIDDADLEIDRIGWARKRKTGLKLRQRLVETKQRLCLLLTTSIASRTSRLQFAIQNHSANAMQRREKDNEKLDLILKGITQLGSDLRTSSKEADAKGQPTKTISPVKDISTPSELQNRSPLPMSANSIMRADSEIVSLQFQKLASEICDDSCNCICHLRDRSWWRSPLILRNVVGFFFLGYTGCSFLKPACTSTTCKSFSTRVFKVTYCMPRWLLARAVHIAAGLTPYGEPQLFGTLQARTNEFVFNSLYHLAQRNNIRGIEDVLERRMASPNDAEQRTGTTALHFSVNARKIEATRLLLRRGAKADVEDDNGVSAIHTAWDQIYSRRRVHPLTEDLQELTFIFPEYRSMDSFAFSDIHKVVLNIFPLSLDGLLLNATWRSQKDFKDAWGRRPIHWALKRNDTAAVETLIRAGVDVNAQAHDGNAPLHIAASLPEVACLQILLKAKVNPRIRNSSGHEPIHFASCASIPHVQALVKAGSSLEEEASNGGVPLGWAACGNQVDIGKYLIEQGVRKDHADKNNGDTPLFSAVSSPHKDFVAMLLDSGVNVKHVNKHGATILHWIARSADYATLDMLSARTCQFSSIDINHKDNAGLTAIGVLRNRVGPPNGFREAFGQFIGSLEELQLREIAGHEVKELGKVGNCIGSARTGSARTLLSSWELVESLTIMLVAIVLAFSLFSLDL